MRRLTIAYVDRLFYCPLFLMDGITNEKCTTGSLCPLALFAPDRGWVGGREPSWRSLRGMPSAVLEPEGEELHPVLLARRAREGECVAVVGAGADGVVAGVGDL